MSIIQCYEVTVGHEETEGGQVPPISTKATLRLKKQTFSKNAWNKKKISPDNLCRWKKWPKVSQRNGNLKKMLNKSASLVLTKVKLGSKGNIRNIKIFIFGFLKGFFFFLSFAKAVQSSADWKFRPWHRPNHIWSSRLCYRRKTGRYLNLNFKFPSPCWVSSKFCSVRTEMLKNIYS